MISKINNLFLDFFFIKDWKIGVSNLNKKDFVSLKSLNKIEKKFEKIDIKTNKYRFFADPFAVSKNHLLVEALDNKFTGRLLLIDKKKKIICKQFSKFKKHISFPSVYLEKKNIYFIPEISHWSDQKIFKYGKRNNSIISEKNIKGLEGLRLKDPIIFKRNKVYYIFFKTSDKNKLQICYSKKSIFGPYKCVNRNYSEINNAPRMAGNILKIDNKLFRIGQTISNLYGNGISIFLITELSPNTYKEKFIKSFKFNNIHGPHTIDFFSNTIIFDYFDLKFDLFAIWKKIQARNFGKVTLKNILK